MSKTLKEYSDILLKVLKENPEYANLKVVYSHDDEGNCFQVVSCDPCVGSFDKDSSYVGDFTSIEQIEEEYPDDNVEINAICIN